MQIFVYYSHTCLFHLHYAGEIGLVGKALDQHVIWKFINFRTPEFLERRWACCGWRPHWVHWDHPASSSFSSVAPSVPRLNTAPCTWPGPTWTSPWGAPLTEPPTPSAAAWVCGQESAGRRMQALGVHPRCRRIWGSHRVAVISILGYGRDVIKV